MRDLKIVQRTSHTIKTTERFASNTGSLRRTNSVPIDVKQMRVHFALGFTWSSDLSGGTIPSETVAADRSHVVESYVSTRTMVQRAAEHIIWEPLTVQSFSPAVQMGKNF